MNGMISVASGFQYSVNIAYDLNNEDKLRNFIPTNSSLKLLKEILQSMSPESTERARVLVGAYGKGKSHIVLTILSILMQKNLDLFRHLLPKIKSDPELRQLARNYYSGKNNKILPVIISGASTSLPQAFLLALQRTLDENNLEIMPDTNYKAAVRTIEKWKSEYPKTFAKLRQKVSMPIEAFVNGLTNYNPAVYSEFETVYPELTSGSTFNPFVGFDVVELYESVVKSLKARGYLGIYVVYDEFSKFLESNITEASVSDTKMLQDFAEKCNRSGEDELHLLLISHKEISNYIDRLPKSKVDGWRGVSDRFRHIHLNNNFTQTYEIISTVIIKNKKRWAEFRKANEARFEKLTSRYQSHPIFSENSDKEFETAVYGCYPLHPVSTFILPRLSERVAQNERTLFTFLSADGASTLPSFIDRNSADEFRVITPDIIFDYFDPVFQKEPLSGELHQNYVLTREILDKIRGHELESKIVKAISLIYLLGQFDRLKPVKEEIVGIFSMEYDPAEIEKALERLIENEYVIYLKRSNGYLKLKQSSGVNVEQEISDTVARLSSAFSLKKALNSSNIDSYLYPSRYNDEKEMTRYFQFEFIEEHELDGDTDWLRKSEGIHADGVVYAVVPETAESIQSIREKVLNSSRDCGRFIFIVPKKAADIRSVLQKYEAVSLLKQKADEDTVLFDEYELIYEDLQDVINSFIRGYTHPEEYRCSYIYKGEERQISRRAALTDLASQICFELYSETPVINNEAINKDDITSIAASSRRKIISALLRNTLEPGLGLSGSGQEVSIMRSTLVRKEVLIDDDSGTRISLQPSDPKMKGVIDAVASFVMDARKEGKVSFGRLYERLVSPEHHIGLRGGVIPIYIAAVFHEYREDIILQNDIGQLSLTADTLEQINSKPSDYYMVYLDWNPEKQEFVRQLAGTFEQYVSKAEQNVSSYEYVASAMKRWYMSLPRFAKESKGLPGRPVDPRYASFLKLLRQNVNDNELLFERLPKAFKYSEFSKGAAENIEKAKEFFDSEISELKKELIRITKDIFSGSADRAGLKRASLSSVIKDWCEKLNPHAFEQLFPNGTDKFLELCRNVTNDADTFVARLAKLATDLRVEDWDDSTIERYSETLKTYKSTAESFTQDTASETAGDTSSYEIHFGSANGPAEIKRFDRVETSSRGKLLYRSIMSEIDSMGSSISEQEKRQILMDVLRKMC